VPGTASYVDDTGSVGQGAVRHNSTNTGKTGGLLLRQLLTKRKVQQIKMKFILP